VGEDAGGGRQRQRQRSRDEGSSLWGVHYQSFVLTRFSGREPGHTPYSACLYAAPVPPADEAGIGWKIEENEPIRPAEGLGRSVSLTGMRLD
jgi:hypothetical protein